MSGRPNIEQINELRNELRAISQLRKDISMYRDRIKSDTAALQESEDVYRKCVATVSRLMDEMDVRSCHNFGWEGRFMTFISELMFPVEKPEELKTTQGG
ncbi:MAG: hypothetical protein JNL58_04365 [Planctomyces sp.]|nr:hypothetical protein [Planctomyces sp.]